jgi:outer membrane protein assembly factor BamB
VSDVLPKASASYFASPVIAGGKLYAAREDGVVFVAQVQDKFEVLAENRMGEQVIASPVAVANRLFIRGEHHLFCIAEE